MSENTDQAAGDVANWTATPQQVERVISAVLPHVEPDGYTPALTCVSLEVDGDQLTAIATDRYTLAICWASLTRWQQEAEPVPSIKVCIYARDWKRLFTFLRVHRKSPVNWSLTADALTVSVGAETTSIRTVTTDFVKWRSIVGNMSAKATDSSGTPVMRFTPTKVDSFIQSAKALGEDTASMSWHFGGEHTDAPLIKIGDNFLGLLMPQRMPDGPPVLDLSALGIGDAPKQVAA